MSTTTDRLSRSWPDLDGGQTEAGKTLVKSGLPLRYESVVSVPQARETRRASLDRPRRVREQS